jgi:hypothetical protein
MQAPSAGLSRMRSSCRGSQPPASRITIRAVQFDPHERQDMSPAPLALLLTDLPRVVHSTHLV